MTINPKNNLYLLYALKFHHYQLCKFLLLMLMIKTFENLKRNFVYHINPSFKTIQLLPQHLLLLYIKPVLVVTSNIKL